MRRRGRVRWAATLAAAVVTASSLATAPATAEPRPSLEQVKARVADLHEKAEATAEAYNAGQIELESAQSRLSANQRFVGEAKRRYEVQREVIGRFAADAYRAGGAGGQTSLAVLLTEDDMTAAMQKLATLDVLEKRQSAALRGIEAARQKLAQAELTARQEAERARSISADLGERKVEVQSLLADATRLLDRLSAEEKARLAAEKAAQARVQAAEAAAERARQAARAATASRVDRARASASTSERDAAPRRASPGGTEAARGAVDAALSKLGRPYVWAAAGPNSFDCSGLIQWAYKQVGIAVPHYTGAIWNGFPRVSRGDLRPGDIVFFYPDVHHAGIYLGGGKMVHAPQTGDVVKISDAFAGRDYTGAVRITG